MTRKHDSRRSPVDAPRSMPVAGAPDHDEWLIDEAVEETFPASDPPLPSRPGSTLAMRYAGQRPAKKRPGKAKAGPRRPRTRVT